MVKNLPAVQETWVQSLGQEDPLENGMATHSSTLAWRIPWREEPGRLQSMGSQRVGHDWATSLHFTTLHFKRKGPVLKMVILGNGLILERKVEWDLYLTPYTKGELLDNLRPKCRSIDVQGNETMGEFLNGISTEYAQSALVNQEGQRDTNANTMVKSRGFRIDTSSGSQAWKRVQTHSSS